MSQNKYLYLFPYEKVPFGSSVVIYGFGDVGREYWEQLQITHYVNLVGFLDRAYEDYNRFPVVVHDPQKILTLVFDYIILAFKQKEHANDVRNQLIAWGVKESQIVFQGARPIFKIELLSDVHATYSSEFAFQRKGLSVAIKIGAGLGDAIIKKRLILELLCMAPELVIDIYTTDRKGIIQSIYQDIPQINQYIVDSGVLYTEQKNEYLLALSLTQLIQIDHMNYAGISEINSYFGHQMIVLKQNNEKYGLSSYPLSQRWIHYGRAFYYKWNCYSLYNYTGIFQIDDRDITIPMNNQFERSYENLNLRHYITLNYGTGGVSSKYQHCVSKQWPKEYFQLLIQLFKEAYPDIEVLQLGDSSTERLAGCDKHILGENLELVKYILKSSMLHVDIESGLVHLATQLGTKCVVLFGPTSERIYGYPQNINIVSPKCSGCAALYDDLYKCAKGLAKPECMWSITPEMVMEKVKEYLLVVFDNA